MSFSAIPDRENTQPITEEWFNSLKSAGQSVETFVASTTSSITTDSNITESGYYFADSSGLGSGVELTITLPSASEDYLIKIVVSNLNDSEIIIDADGSTINGQSTYSLTLRYESITLKSDGSNWFIF